jgi:hypothetical protein
MNGTQLIDGVVAQCGLATTDPQFTRPVVLGFLNQALSAYQGVAAFPWLEATGSTALVSGTRAYAPSGASRIVDVWVVDSAGLRRNLDQVSDEEIADTYDETGKPRLWAVQWAATPTLLVSPVPNAAGETLWFRYVAVEVALADSGVAPALPAELHDLLISHACRLVNLARNYLEPVSAFALVTDPPSVLRLTRAATDRRGTPRIRRRMWAEF